MNTLVVKKQAEVQAFINLVAIIKRQASSQALNQISVVVSMLDSLQTDLTATVQGKNRLAIFEDKKTRTEIKLSEMMNLYIGKEWNNPIEILEWLSFYAGAAQAHASLSASLLGANDLNQESELFEDLSSKYERLLNEVITALKRLGQGESY